MWISTYYGLYFSDIGDDNDNDDINLFTFSVQHLNSLKQTEAIKQATPESEVSSTKSSHSAPAATSNDIAVEMPTNILHSPRDQEEKKVDTVDRVSFSQDNNLTNSFRGGAIIPPFEGPSLEDLPRRFVCTLRI